MEDGSLDVGNEILGMEYEIFVKKDLENDDGKFFTEDDLNPSDGSEDKENQGEEKISRGALIAIIIGTIVGVIGFLVLGKLAYNIY